MTSTIDPEDGGVRDENRELVVELEIALAELAAQIPGGLAGLELVKQARLRSAARRLLECSTELAASQLLIPGSTGQQRINPLLNVERDLRREIADGLAELTFRAESRAMRERLNLLTAEAPDDTLEFDFEFDLEFDSDTPEWPEADDAMEGSS